MATPSYFIYREQGSEPFDPTAPLQFYPSKESDELFFALMAAYPTVTTHSERMRNAVIDFLMNERDAERTRYISGAAESSSSSSSFDSTTTSPAYSGQYESAKSVSGSPRLLNPAVSRSHASSPSYTTSLSRTSSQDHSAASPVALEQMTSVFSLSAQSQPKTKVRRKMTEAEKVEYRKRRLVKACEKCSKRKRKCTHNVSQMDRITTSRQASKQKAPVTMDVSQDRPVNAKAMVPAGKSQADDDPFAFLNIDPLLDLIDFDQPLTASDQGIEWPLQSSSDLELFGYDSVLSGYPHQSAAWSPFSSAPSAAGPNALAYERDEQLLSYSGNQGQALGARHSSGLQEDEPWMRPFVIDGLFSGAGNVTPLVVAPRGSSLTTASSSVAIEGGTDVTWCHANDADYDGASQPLFRPARTPGLPVLATPSRRAGDGLLIEHDADIKEGNRLGLISARGSSKSQQPTASSSTVPSLGSSKGPGQLGSVGNTGISTATGKNSSTSSLSEVRLKVREVVDKRNSAEQYSNVEEGVSAGHGVEVLAATMAGKGLTMDNTGFAASLLMHWLQCQAAAVQAIMAFASKKRMVPKHYSARRLHSSRLSIMV